MTTSEPTEVLPERDVHLARPFGLKAIIALQLIQALWSILLSILLFSALRSPDQIGLSLRPVMQELLSVSQLLLIVLVPIRLVTAIGLWRFRQWAWVLTMALLSLSMAIDALAFFRRETFSSVSMLLNVVIVFYLNQNEVRNLFSGKETKTPR